MKPEQAQTRRRKPQEGVCEENGGRVDTFTAEAPALPLLAVDTREQMPLTFQHFPSAAATLTTGDYGLADLPRRFCIERKSMADLIGSLTTERARFEKELHRMEAYPFRRLLIVGTLAELHSLLSRRKVTAASIAGSLRAIDATRAPVVRVDTPQRAAELVEVWAWYVWRDYWRPFRKLETPDFIREQPFPC